MANRRPDEAAMHLDRIPEADRKDLSTAPSMGIVALYENKADDAIESWSRGLKIAGGSDAELSWRLAYVLLQLGRVEDAEPLISQFRRVVGLTPEGGEPTTAIYLEALRSSRPTARPRRSPGWGRPA